MFLILMLVLGTALVQSQNYEKFYFYKKSVVGAGIEFPKEFLTNGYVKLNYTEDKVTITLFEEDSTYMECELDKIIEEHNHVDLDIYNLSVGLKYVKSFYGKYPTDKDIYMIQWTNLNVEGRADNDRKYAYTFIIDGVESLFYCSEQYVKEKDSSILKFYKLKEW